MTHNKICGHFVHNIANGVKAVIHSSDIVFLTTTSYLVLHAVGDKEEEQIAALGFICNILKDIYTITADCLHYGCELVPENHKAVCYALCFYSLLNLGEPFADILGCECDAYCFVEELSQAPYMPEYRLLQAFR